MLLEVQSALLVQKIYCTACKSAVVVSLGYSAYQEASALLSFSNSENREVSTFPSTKMSSRLLVGWMGHETVKDTSDFAFVHKTDVNGETLLLIG